jgi:two-component system OmpR family response regulator
MLVQPLALELELAVPTVARHTVLIVDDEESIAEPLRVRLERLGFDTLTAKTGRQASDLARRRRPDCITLDVGLPDIDGFELCQQLVDDEATSEIPVIIVSGNDSPDVVRRARAAGCHFYVRKPFDPNALLALIRQAIDAGTEEE